MYLAVGLHNSLQPDEGLTLVMTGLHSRAKNMLYQPLFTL